jgi:hypothetical protein
MFLATIASRPRHNDRAGVDEKIGKWPFMESAIAQRASINHPVDTIQKKPAYVTAETYKQFLIGKVILAIKRKWPDRSNELDMRTQHLSKW